MQLLIIIYDEIIEIPTATESVNHVCGVDGWIPMASVESKNLQYRIVRNYIPLHIVHARQVHQCFSLSQLSGGCDLIVLWLFITWKSEELYREQPPSPIP